MSTVCISYDLAKDDEAQAFRVAVAAEGLFSALIDFHRLVVQRRDRRAPSQPSHVVRALLLKRVTQRTAAWALKANALKPKGWRRPLRRVTLTVEVGFPYVALLNAEGIFTAIRAIDASFPPDDSRLPWKDMVSTILVKLEDNGVSAAFHHEMDSRGKR
jgi:hypothetical protein